MTGAFKHGSIERSLSRVGRIRLILGLSCFIFGAAIAEERHKEQKSEDASERKTQVHASEDPPRAQALGKNISGVFVNSAVSNSGYSPDFVMRGFPTALNLFEGTSHGFMSQTVDLSTIDHVEFYKGPGAMLYGNALGGYGGAANYIRKTPTEDLFARSVMSFGAFGVVRTNFDVNSPLDDQKKLLFRVTGSAEKAGSFVDFVRLRSFDFAPALTYRLDNGDILKLRAEYNAARVVFRDGVPADPIFLHIPRNFYAGVPANEQEPSHFADFSLAYDHAFNQNWRASIVADYFLSAVRYGWFQGWGYDGFQSLTLGQPVRTRSAVRSFDAQFRLHGSFGTGFLQHSAFFGLEHWDFFSGHADIIGRYPLAPINVFAPIYPPGINYSNAYWANGAARAWSQSAYAQDLIDLSEHWRILIGGRYDLLAQREKVFDPFGALSGEPTDSVSKGIKGYFSARAGLLYRPNDKTDFFLAFGQSLIPNTYVRLQSGEAPPPQQDTQYEIGIKRQLDDPNVTLEIGLFDITRNHVAIPNPANPSGFYSLVTGQQHSHGVEASVGGEIYPNLKVNAAATFLHAVVSKDNNIPSQAGNDLLGAPRRVYNFSAAYTFDTGLLKGLVVGASYYYASRAEATLPNTYGFTLAPQQMLGFSMAYNITDNLKFEVNATNLTNRQNFTSGGSLYHGEPRGFNMSLTAKY